jgi:hypothetical protein
MTSGFPQLNHSLSTAFYGYNNTSHDQDKQAADGSTHISPMARHTTMCIHLDGTNTLLNAERPTGIFAPIEMTHRTAA